ncbi:hypothetical protein LWI29_008480 [Acer saccharum]|uniref:Uncharacterized protein n=1 Tax=Acer saccharum TaxID=4024 RepID=A0AA39RH93_ACESA|nr:hypothetical protein LWI29_008480 [Acer saccharum]
MVYPIQFHKVIEVLNLDEETKKLPRLLMVEQYYLFSKEVKPSTALEEVLEVKEMSLTHSRLGGIMSILEFDNNVGKHQCALFLDLHQSNVHHSWRLTKSIEDIYEQYMQKEIDEIPEPVTTKTRGADVLLLWL